MACDGSDEPEAHNEVPYRTLPGGKYFHVFFPYINTEEEKTWVQEVVKYLESKYSIISCIKAINDDCEMDKIIEFGEHIDSSLKTVFFISEIYTDVYIKTKLNEVISDSENPNLNISLVHRQDCSLPEFIGNQHINVINATGHHETWLPKLAATILSNVYCNLDIIHELRTSSALIGQSFEDSSMPDHLRTSNLNITTTEFSSIMTSLASSRLVRWRHCVVPWWPVIMFYYTIMFCAILYIEQGKFNYVETFTSKGEQLHYSHSGLAFIVEILIFGILGISWPTFCTYSSREGRYEMKKLLLEINRTLMQYKIFVVCKTSKIKAEIKFIFLYYDSYPCIGYIEKHQYDYLVLMKARLSGTYTHEDNENTCMVKIQHEDFEETPQAVATRLIQEFSMQYLEDYVKRKLEKSELKKHSMTYMCLCEYTEKQLQKGFSRGHCHE